MSSSSSQEFASTYEATKAQEWNASQADKIHWSRHAAYRNQPYRHLHHQNGTIGTFQVRLLEAADLKRSYWSALAVGPVKLLGLSKAHGAVSSIVSFMLDTSPPGRPGNDDPDRKPSASDDNPNLKLPPCFVSPVIPQDDNPVWNNCHFDLHLRKGALQDGQPIRLQIRVDEDSTAVENILPGIASGGDSRLLGTGTLDLTSLCLGQVVETGQPQVGVLDTWVPISLNGQPSEDPLKDVIHSPDPLDPLKKKAPVEEAHDKESGCTGRVRVLVSYQPHGMEPQGHDIVALEAFARNDPRTGSCPPIIPSLLPFHVLETSGPWLLVEYQLQNRKRRHFTSDDDSKACLRLHRNAVFVVERKNILDETLNLALLPADILLSTPFGKSTQELVGPLFVASKQLLMPALLSTKLVWMAVRTTGVATLSGVGAASSALWNEGSSSLTNDEDGDPRAPDGSKYKFVTL